MGHSQVGRPDSLAKTILIYVHAVNKTRSVSNVRGQSTSVDSTVHNQVNFITK